MVEATRDVQGSGSRIFRELVNNGIRATGPSLLINKQLLDKGYDPEDVDLAIELYQCVIGLHESVLPGDTSTNDIDIEFTHKTAPGRQFMGFFYFDGRARYVFCTANIKAAFDAYARFMRLKFKDISEDELKLACVANVVRGYLVFRKSVEPFMIGDEKWTGGEELELALVMSRIRRQLPESAPQEVQIRGFDGMVIEILLAIMFVKRVDPLSDLETLVRAVQINAPDRSGTPFN